MTSRRRNSTLHSGQRGYLGCASSATVSMQARQNTCLHFSRAGAVITSMHTGHRQARRLDRLAATPHMCACSVGASNLTPAPAPEACLPAAEGAASLSATVLSAWLLTGASIARLLPPQPLRIATEWHCLCASSLSDPPSARQTDPLLLFVCTARPKRIHCSSSSAPLPPEQRAPSRCHLALLAPKRRRVPDHACW